MFINTMSYGGDGIMVSRGLVIDDGNSIFTTGQVSAGGRNISNTTMTEIATTHADYGVLNDRALRDRTDAVHSGVFAWSTAANAGRGGWAIQTATGFRDVNNEDFTAYQANLGFDSQVGGAVGLSREASIAALDATSPRGRMMQALRQPNAGAVAPSTIDAMLRANITAEQAAEFAALEARPDMAPSIKNAALMTFAQLVATNQAALPSFRELIGVNGLSTANTGATVDSRATIIRHFGSFAAWTGATPEVVSSLKDLILSAKSSYNSTATFRQPGWSEAHTAITNFMAPNGKLAMFNSIVSSPNSNNQVRDQYLSLVRSGKSDAVLNTFKDMVVSGKSHDTISAYTTLLQAPGATPAMITDFTTIANDPTIRADRKEAVLQAFVPIALTKPASVTTYLLALARLDKNLPTGLIERFKNFALNTSNSSAAISAFTAITQNVLSRSAGTEAERFNDLNTVLSRLETFAAGTTDSDTQYERIRAKAATNGSSAQILELIGGSPVVVVPPPGGGGGTGGGTGGGVGRGVPLSRRDRALQDIARINAKLPSLIPGSREYNSAIRQLQRAQSRLN